MTIDESAPASVPPPISQPDASPADLSTIRWLGYAFAAVATLGPLLAVISPPGLPAAVLAVLAVMLPLLTLLIVVRAPAAFEVATPRFNRRTVNFLMLIPALILAAVTISTHLVSPQMVLLMAAAGATLALLVAIWTPERGNLASPGGFLLFLILFGAGFGWGAPTLLDRQLDRSTGTVYHAQVAESGVGYGRSGLYYHVTLAPWGPVAKEARVSVSKQTYEALTASSEACVTLYPGALGLAWYQAASC